MPKLLKELEIFSVDSVDKGAGEACRVMIMKKREDAISILEAVQKSGASRAVVGEVLKREVMKLKKDGEHYAKAFARLVDRRNPSHDPACAGLFKMVGDMSGPDHFITKNNNDDEIGKPPGDAEIGEDDDMEKECRNWMKANPGVKSKSQAYDAVSRTARGKAILRRDRMKAGIGV